MGREEANLASGLGVERRLARALALGVPAFVRCARRLEAEERRFHLGLERELLARAAVLLPLARRLEALGRCGVVLPERTAAALRRLREHPDFERRQAAPPRNAKRALRAFEARRGRFNRRWLATLESVPLDGIRRLQADTNRCCPLARELAPRDAPPLAFQPVRLLERGDLVRRYPPL